VLHIYIYDISHLRVKYYTVLSVLFSTALVSGAEWFSVDIRHVEFIDQLRGYWILNVHFTTRS